MVSVHTVRGHKETSTTGKWDPGRIDMDRFRHVTLEKMNEIRNKASVAKRASLRMAALARPLRAAVDRLTARRSASPEAALESEPTT